MNEDPPEGCFTQNVIFHAGNYVVYSGLSPSAYFILQNLLKSIYCFEDSYPETFLSEVTCGVRTMLSLSNEVALRLGHERFMTNTHAFSRRIHVPGVESIGNMVNALTFTLGEIFHFLQGWNWVKGFLNPFKLDISDPDQLFAETEKNPLWYRPLVAFGKKIVVAAPGEILPALNHFILCCASKHNCLASLIYQYRKVLSAAVQVFMHNSALETLDIELPPQEEGLPLDEFLFRIDTDKAAYVQLVSDDLQGFVCADPYTRWKPDSLLEELAKRSQELTERLTGESQGSFSKILVLTVIGSMGREGIIVEGTSAANSLHVILPADELYILVQLRHFDPLNLWKFAKARERLHKSTHSVLSLSFLDSYAIFQDNQRSFYTGDGYKPTFLLHAPGSGAGMRADAERFHDIHAARYGDPPKFMPVIRYETDVTIPIYYPEHGLVLPSLTRLVDGYRQPIWIEPLNAEDAHDENARQPQRLVADMLSYWIWQLTPSLRPHLFPLGEDPVTIRFVLENPSCWVEQTAMPDDNCRALTDCRMQVSGRNAHFEIPEALLLALASESNWGERIILAKILELLGQILGNAGKDSTLGDKEKNRMIDSHAPLGPKKRVLVIPDNRRPALDPRNLTNLRTIQEYDIQVQLDGLVDELKLGESVAGEITVKGERTKLCNEIVSLLVERLCAGIRRFHWSDLVPMLIGQHEAYWYKGATDMLTLPTRVECFGELASNEECMADDWMRFQATGTAIRTLLEVVAAEPPVGCKTLSQEAVDSLIATAHLVVYWATVSDHIHYDVMDYRVSILQSGRIAAQTSDLEESWEPFVHSKSSERLLSATAGFSAHFISENALEDTKQQFPQFDDAFDSEFGLSPFKIADLMSALTLLGFSQEGAACCMRLSKLSEKLKDDLKWNEDAIRTAISQFSLKPRNRWDVAPKGFSAARDIWPWRHNRRLSYIRRQLIVCLKIEEDPLVFWGPRHCNEAWMHLLDEVCSGRYHSDSMSPEMDKLIRKIRDEQGTAFERTVTRWLKQNSSWEITEGVAIGPGRAINATKDRGDIDVLCIDRQRRRILSVECKNLKFAKTPRSIANESKRLAQDWVPKHQARDEWLNSNKDLLTRVFDLGADDFEVISVVITSDSVPSAYLESMPIPVVPFTLLQRDGLPVLEHLAEG
ncbi:hypothetical protein ACFL2Q_10430 [Thermodesulfobacteriota bacterium]